jgi:metal-responsive CopG/Arc/MetJ family transcriptional regulator
MSKQIVKIIKDDSYNESKFDRVQSYYENYTNASLNTKENSDDCIEIIVYNGLEYNGIVKGCDKEGLTYK